MGNQQASESETRLAANFQRAAFVPAEIQYRGCRIVWDARRPEGMLFWTGKVAVVTPRDIANIERVHRVYQSDHFLSEADARDHLIGAAKDWIDNRIKTAVSHEH